MANLVKVWKCGKVQFNCIQGEYEGEKTYSFTVQKNTYDEKKEGADRFGKSDFMTKTDLRDLNLALGEVLTDNVKSQEITQRQADPEPEEEPAAKEEVDDENIPF